MKINERSEPRGAWVERKPGWERKSIIYPPCLVKLVARPPLSPIHWIPGMAIPERIILSTHYKQFFIKTSFQRGLISPCFGVQTFMVEKIALSD